MSSDRLEGATRYECHCCSRVGCMDRGFNPANKKDKKRTLNLVCQKYCNLHQNVRSRQQEQNNAKANVVFFGEFCKLRKHLAIIPVSAKTKDVRSIHTCASFCTTGLCGDDISHGDEQRLTFCCLSLSSPLPEKSTRKRAIMLSTICREDELQNHLRPQKTDQ